MTILPAARMLARPLSQPSCGAGRSERCSVTDVNTGPGGAPGYDLLRARRHAHGGRQTRRQQLQVRPMRCCASVLKPHGVIMDGHSIPSGIHAQCFAASARFASEVRHLVLWSLLPAPSPGLTPAQLQSFRRKAAMCLYVMVLMRRASEHPHNLHNRMPVTRDLRARHVGSRRS